MLEKIIKTKLIFFILLLLIANDLLAIEAEKYNCEGVNEERVEQYRDYILSGNVALLSRHIRFPVQVVVGGKVVSIRDESFLKITWKVVSTERLLNLVSDAAYCELAKELKMDPVSGNIGSLAIYYDEKDAKYSYSGITSERDLLNFLTMLVKLISEKEYRKLSGFFRYPFAVQGEDDKIVINNGEDFYRYKELIVTNEFISIVTKSLDEENFVQHPIGLMLNEVGDIWVVEVSSGLLIQPVIP